MWKRLNIVQINTIIWKYFKKLPLKLPSYPSNTQAVERMVRVVTEVANKKARHRMILKLLESRKMVPKFNTKKDDSIL